jgi:hypothetical protein
VKLKIVSDGTPRGTKVRDADTGREIDDVREVRWRLKSGQPAEAMITFRPESIDLEVDAARVYVDEDAG